MSSDQSTSQQDTIAVQQDEPVFSLIIPCYNEELALRDAIEGLRKQLSGCENYELIIVNDGSSDRTSEILAELVLEMPELVVYEHSRNRGYGAALKSGIRSARSNCIVITDADGTYPNERIPEIVELTQRYDMVVGARIGDDVTYSKLRKIPKIFLKAYASWLAGENIPDLNSGLRAFRRDVALKFLHMLPSGFSFTTTITMAHLTNGYRVHYLPIGYKQRIGKSKIQPIRDTLRFSQLIMRMGMYFAPMRVLGPFCFVFSVMFVVSLCYDVFVARNLTDKTVLLLMSSMNTFFFMLLADMIEKRST